MFNYLAIIFVLTFIFTRILSHLLHNKENDSKSKTLTRVVRKRTNFDFHHIHLGIIFMFVFGFWMIFEINFLTLSLFLIGLSLFLDQVVPAIYHYNLIKFEKKLCYFSFFGIFWASFLHLLALIILYFLI